MREGESFVYTACPGWGDHDYCAIKTIVKDGKIVRTEKPTYTGPEADEGFICQKGIMSARQPYNPDRLLYPLKRAGERGEGKWERISWDQALDEIAEKIAKIRTDYGKESFVIWALAASIPPAGGFGTMLSERFCHVLGATNPIYTQGLDNGPVYTNFYTFGQGSLYMLTDPANIDDADHIIIWGADPIANQERVAKHVVEAHDRGAKVVDIGLVYDVTAGFSDEFVGVKPGSDPFLALAMAKIIIEEDLFDREFVTKYTVAAYLIDEAGDYARDADGNFFVACNGAPAAVAAKGGALPEGDIALDGEYEIDGKKYVPVWAKFIEHLQTYTLERTEKVTGVAPETVCKLAHEYAAADNAYILGALGLRYINQGESYRAMHMLGAITGNLGRPGAGVTVELIPTSYPINFNNYELMRPENAEGNKENIVRMFEFFEQVKQDDCPYKGMMITAGNPVHNNPNRSRWVNMFNKMDLVVSFDVWMTDTAELADYVLPDTMPFEREELIQLACYNHVVLQEPAIEPQGEARDMNFVYQELAKRLGYGEYFTKSIPEYIDDRLKSDYPLLAAVDPPITYERLKKEKIIRTVAPADQHFDPFAGLRFSTQTGRIEFYADRLRAVDLEFPSYTPPLESPVIDGNDKYPYQLFTGRQRFFMQSMFTDDPVMRDLSGGKPHARINPVDAAKKGILDGDTIEVFNQRGHVIVDCYLDEAIPPQTVHVWFGWRKRHFDKGMYSELLVPLSDKSVQNEAAEKWYSDWIDAGGFPETGLVRSDAALGGSWDTMWDVACDFRKYEEEEGE